MKGLGQGLFDTNKDYLRPTILEGAAKLGKTEPAIFVWDIKHFSGWHRLCCRRLCDR